MINFGDVPAGSVLPIPFDSFAAAGESATISGLAVTDVEIYPGTSMTQRTSDNGVALMDTDGIDLDGITGAQGFSIDLSDNSDSGFYAVGTRYRVVVSAITVDSKTVNFTAAIFRIVAAEAIAGKPKVDVDAWLGTAAATPGTAGVPSVDAIRVSTSSTAADNLETAALAYSATRGLAGTALPAAAADAAGGLIISNAGGLDADAQLVTKINDILTDTGTTLQGELDGIQADTEDIQSKIGTPSATLAADIATRASQASLDTVDDLLDTEIPALTSELAKVPKSDGTVGWNATARAQIQQEAQDAIEANHLDHLLAADYDPTSKPGVATALLNELIGNDGGVSQFTTNALENALTGGGGGGGSGARTVTITVNDGSTVLENANVRMIQGAENYVVATNASGVAVFALDDATWSVAITKPGYTFTPTTIVVNGTETQTYSMTALTITPSNPSQVTGYLTIFGTDGEVEQGADIHLQQLQPVSGSGIGYDGAVRTEESGADGVVEFTNLFPGARYNIWRGTDTANKKQFTLAANATDPTALSSFVGSP